MAELTLTDKLLSKRTKTINNYCKNGWEMASYCNYNDNYVYLKYKMDKVALELVLTGETAIPCRCSFEVNKEDLTDVANNPKEFIKNLSNSVDFVDYKQSVIDFAQDTILKAIKGE